MMRTTATVRSEHPKFKAHFEERAERTPVREHAPQKATQKLGGAAELLP
jgi:hypothetical protein